MKKTLIILGICFYSFSTKVNCQMKTNKYEVEIDKLLAEKNPNYYDNLKKILSEFQKNLISKDIITDNTYQSYIGLLKQINEDDKTEFQIEYNLKSKLKKLGEGITEIIPSTENTLIAINYLNIDNSKGFLFNQKVSQLVKNGQKLNRSILSELILESYNEDDFRLPLIKLKIFQFLDPNSVSKIYLYAGRPSLE